MYTTLDKINSIFEVLNEVLYSISDNTKEQRKLGITILKAITKNKWGYYNSKIIDLLFNSFTYIKSTYNGNSEPKSEVHFIYRRNLSFNCKVFIMSATTDQEICQRLFGQDMVIFREFDIPKLAASITMKYDSTFSKDWFKRKISSLCNHTKYLESLRDFKLCRIEKKLVSRETNNQPLIITFNKYEAAFRDLGFTTLMHFGNTTGVDIHKGKDVVVFGTYNLHPIAYSLYTKAIYPEEPMNMVPKYSDVLVANSDYSFYIHTPKEFRKVQLWKVESEMIQALGGARPIDNKYLIRIYSNIPPAGIDITFI